MIYVYVHINRYQAAEKTKQQLIEKTKDYELKLHSSKYVRYDYDV